MQKREIVIEIAGGLGNQMFQYAFYLKMKHLGYNCKLYFDASQQLHNGFELKKVFNIDVTFVSRSEIDELLDKKQDLFSKVRRKMSGHNSSFYWEHDKGYAYRPEIFNQKQSVYLQGCWLSAKYFEDIESEVRLAFTFKTPDRNNLNFFNQIVADENAISIHIRRGDYTKSSTHRNLDYPAYLTHAISLINEKIINPCYYIFSDDITFAKEVLQNLKVATSNTFFIDWNEGELSWMDLQLMSTCKHNIIANSTFSWWGAWLNTFKNKIVITPKDWFTINEWNNNSIIPDSWIAL